jgi:hypothetical protein
MDFSLHMLESFQLPYLIDFALARTIESGAEIGEHSQQHPIVVTFDCIVWLNARQHPSPQLVSIDDRAQIHHKEWIGIVL